MMRTIISHLESSPSPELVYKYLVTVFLLDFSECIFRINYLEVGYQGFISSSLSDLAFLQPMGAGWVP